MKSEEKQLDLLLYNLGGSRAVNERASKNRNQKSIKVTKAQEHRVAVLPETPMVKLNQPSQANNKTRTNPNTNGTQRKKNQQQPVQVQSNKSDNATQNNKQTTQVIQAVTPDTATTASSQEQVDLEFRLKLQIAYDKAKNQIAKNALAIRKKMPGYVYPSRQEMLLDQQAKEDVPSDK